MFDIDRPDQPTFTTGKLVLACETAEARLAPLIAILTPLARTRPDTPVPGDLLLLARQALSPAQRIARALDMPSLTPLHLPVGHAALAARLGLAAQLAATFRQRYFVYNQRARARVWRVHPWFLHALNERLAEDQLEGRTPMRD